MKQNRTLTGILGKACLLLVTVGVLSLFSSCTAVLRESDRSSPSKKPGILTPAAAEMKAELILSPSAAVPCSFTEKRQYTSMTADWIGIWDTQHGAGASDTVLLTAEEIHAYNTRMIENCPTLVDMTAKPEPLTGDAVRSMILAYSLPVGDYFDRDGNPWSVDRRNRLLENRALDLIGEEIMPECAVIVARCDMKGFPTEFGFYRWGDTHYNAIQETELIVGQPAQILHHSGDGTFVFVQTHAYRGWIPADCVAAATWADVSRFASPEQYVTVTDSVTEIGSVRLDMGVRLPYLGENDDTYTVLLPTRNTDGSLSSTEVSLDRSSAVYGSLPYTMKNYYEQAFRYAGTPYGWGGADGGIDCSGFVNAVFRTFGIDLPRNTGELSRYSGEVHSLSGKSQDEVSVLLTSATLPVSLYRPGHVMLYLGMRDSVPTIIHAPMAGGSVCIVPLDLSTITEIAVMH